MILKIFITIILIVCVSCDDDSRHLVSMLNKLTKHSQRQYRLDCVGSGFAAPNVIKEFLLTFEYDQPIDYEEARRLIVNLTEDLIKIAKSDPTILENLETPTFTENNLYYLIVLTGNGPDFTGIALSNGKIKFLTSNPPKLFTDVKIESYSEAYFKVYGTNLYRA